MQVWIEAGREGEWNGGKVSGILGERQVKGLMSGKAAQKGVSVDEAGWEEEGMGI